MLGSRTCEIISISYNVCGAGKYCEEVAMRIQLLMFQGLHALAERGNTALKRCSDWLQVRNCSEFPHILLLEEKYNTINIFLLSSLSILFTYLFKDNILLISIVSF